MTPETILNDFENYKKEIRARGYGSVTLKWEYKGNDNSHYLVDRQDSYIVKENEGEQNGK
jgi:hypothetical protein